MSVRRANRLAKCVKTVEACVKDPRIWNRAGWEGVLQDIDDGIKARRLQIKELMRSRPVVLRNLENFAPYAWDDSALDVKDGPKSRAVYKNNQKLRKQRSVAK